MIFVTVGTTSFDALIKVCDELKTDEEMVLQIYDGKYVPKNHEYFVFKEDIDKYFEKSDLVITHGGAGTIFKLLSMGKKIIAVENTERNDDHQADLLKKLADEKAIIWCKDLGKLNTMVSKAKKFAFKRYVKPECKIAVKITGG